MATLYSSLLPIIRNRLIEVSPKYWADSELYEMMFAGTRDLWRDIVDLKQEHYLTVDNTNVSLAANTGQLTGVPTDVHKVFLIEPLDTSNSGTSRGLIFQELDYNNKFVQAARSQSAIDPASGVIYYSIVGQGTPVNAPIIYVAPKVTSAVQLSFSYVPSLGTLTSSSTVPIPGEADNAIIAWVIAYSRAKEREDRSPDDAWLMIYATEKQHLLQSLGLRQLAENKFVEALFEENW